MSDMPIVKIDGIKLSDNTFTDGDDVWYVTNLIERAKELVPFDLPLAAIYSGSEVWSPVSSAYDLAKQMRRVLDVNTDYPVILDARGFIMDGWHRVTRALVDGKATIKAVRFDKTPAPDYVRAKA